jgi:hypothetical protein
MARAKRRQPYDPSKVHDRKATDLLRNAVVAPIEIDDPFALEPGEKIVVMTSVRDMLPALRARRVIDEAQYYAGREFERFFYQTNSGLKAINLENPYVDTSFNGITISDDHCDAVEELKRADRALGLEGSSLIRNVLIHGMSFIQIAALHGMASELETKYIGRRFRECLDTLAKHFGFANRDSQERRQSSGPLQPKESAR